MKDIAKAAGVHVSTVSLALRGRESISKKTRARITELAREMGYRPDPRLDAFNYQRSLLIKSRSLPSLAYISDMDTVQAMNRHPEQSDVYRGLKTYCDEQGIALGVFFMGDGRLSSSRLAGILESRGINALALHYCRDDVEVPELNWSLYSVVKVDSHHVLEGMDSLGPNHRLGSRMAVKGAVDAGYQRPALVLDRTISSHCQGMFEVGYFLQMEEEGLGFLPVCYELSDGRGLKLWLDAHQPDVILTPQVARLRDGLGGGVDLPVLGMQSQGDEALPWVGSAYEEAGRQVAQLLVQKIQTNDKGMSGAPCLEWLPLKWG